MPGSPTARGDRPGANSTIWLRVWCSNRSAPCASSSRKGIVRVGVASTRVWRIVGPDGSAGAGGEDPRSAGAASVRSDPEGVHWSRRDGADPWPRDEVPMELITWMSPADDTLPSLVSAIQTSVRSSRCARKASREPSGDHMRSLT